LRSGARQAWRWLRMRVEGVRAEDADVHHAELEFASGLVAGYLHHQRRYRQSAELRDWVHKPMYL
jgi:hypothetical protein